MCIRCAHRRVYILYYFLREEIRIALKFRAEIARAAVKFHRSKEGKKRRKKKQTIRVRSALSRDPAAIRRRRRKERIRGNLYRSDDKISLLSFLLLPLFFLPLSFSLSFSLVCSHVLFANDFPLLISSPSARRGAPRFARSLALFLSSSDDKSETSHVHTQRRAPKGGNKRFVAAARQEPP